MNATAEQVKPAELLKLDIGCGKNKQAGYHGVDQFPFEGVDTVADVREVPWPWASESVSAIHCSHFLEHLDAYERIDFFNESYRVLAWGGTMYIQVPSWSHERAYGDPTHKWPPVSGWLMLYLQESWRKDNAPHVDAKQTDGFGYTCDFDWSSAGIWDQWLNVRNHDMKLFAMARYINSTSDLCFNLTKVKRPDSK